MRSKPERRSTRSLAVAIICAAGLALAGCTAAQPPKPTASSAPAYNVAVAPSSTVSATDAAIVSAAAKSSGEPYRQTEQLPDTTAARLKFPGALFPRDTLGRRLIAIIYTKLDERKTSGEPKRTLRLIYEGGLQVDETNRYTEYVLSSRTEKPVQVGPYPGRIDTFPSDGTPTTRVKWTVPEYDNSYAVSGVGIPPADVVRVAESMAP